MSDRLALIRERIESALSPESLEISDDSHLHVGHPGAQSGAGHYSVRIVAEGFRGLNRIKRHQLVYAAVADMLPDQIHALRIQALTPEDSQTG